MNLNLKSNTPKLFFKSKLGPEKKKPSAFQDITFTAVVNMRAANGEGITKILVPVSGYLVHGKRIPEARFVIYYYFHVKDDGSVISSDRWAVGELTSGLHIWHPGMVHNQGYLMPLSREDVLSIAEDRCLMFGEAAFWRFTREAAHEKALLELEASGVKPKLQFKPRGATKPQLEYRTKVVLNPKDPWPFKNKPKPKLNFRKG